MEENKKIELDFKKYEELITENISLKKELEYRDKQNETVTITSNSHTPPETKEEKKETKKGIF